jgi:2-polyprenyl-3-methyl-5-hydroxy-6-metoxy-1,4-benzoquinol methylase
LHSSADNIIGLYERNAHNYVADRRRVHCEESGWLDRLIDLIAKSATILDIGCGCGEPIAQYFMDRNFTVEGVDASPTLISICRARFPKQRWHVADMRNLALGRGFDAILAWDSFFPSLP